MPFDSSQSRRAIIGGVLILALIATAGVLFFFLDDVRESPNEYYRLVAVFPAAQRLRPGAAVWLSGHPVGRVTAIDFLAPGGDTAANVAATLKLPDRVRPLIRRNSELRLRPPRPFGDPVVRITVGDAPAPALEPGDTLYGRPPATLDTALARARSLTQSLSTLLDRTRALGEQAEARRGGIERILERLRAARARFAQLTAALADAPFAEALTDGALRARLDSLRAAARRLVRAVRAQPWTGGGDTLRAAARRLARRAERLEANIARLEALLSRPRGLAGRLPRDTALAAALRGVRAQLDSLLAEVRRNPGRFVF